ncbi:hypothetical protein, partial [Acinetobacter baumannii]|uniref:hypothetical protein n=1 Tax=Acinetobacter baumannii TaxID=470 RepID=UPI0013D38776
IRTNAVAFGKFRGFVAGLVVFVGAYGLLAGLAIGGFVPSALVFSAALIPVHLFASLQAMRAGLTFDALRRLQRGYR